MTQIERCSVFHAFRETTAAVLICTDVAARGIDIPLVDLVVQYHAPQILADYVHRVGRTARAGESGKAVLFIEPSEMDFIKYLSNKHIRIKEQSATGVIRNFGRFINSDTKCNSELKEYRAVEFQHRYEQLINEENELFDGAKKAFTSWFGSSRRSKTFIARLYRPETRRQSNPVFKRKEQHNSKQLNLLQDKKKLSGRYVRASFSYW
ncbi:probable ATP-dependent RNA helicase CG8611 [Anopheles stephensi]|uniref:probable ATP-dependent RNA helicase CG8611 n=1 Tax=Anopheles stephensi TaxID=30069 RepID=UPI001658B47A|nr:probable ATP-dependent RNA helicase CG8611 [Anopheles stephensi]